MKDKHSKRRTGSLLASPILAALLGAFVSADASAQGVERWNRECQKLLKSYPSKPRHKAFAASNTNSTGVGQGCGVAWGAGSKAQAEKSAVSACQKAKFGTCWVIRSE